MSVIFDTLFQMKETLRRAKNHRHIKPILIVVGAILLPGPALIPLIVYIVYRMRRKKSSDL